MISEIFLVLAGHESSLFPSPSLHPQFAPLLHPGEQQCLESLAQIGFRYRKIIASCNALSRSTSRYIAAVSRTLTILLKDYQTLVVSTEAKVLLRDPNLVASASFVPLSSIRAIFAEWDAPFAALVVLVEQLEAEKSWKPGPLIDLLLARSHTGVHRISDILSSLAVAVQRVWRTQLTAFVIHGSLSPVDPLASETTYILQDGSMPSCVSEQSRDSIAYVGRAIATVKAAQWQKQLPRDLASEHTKLLQEVLPEDQHAFDRVILQIRTNVSEWLWLNVLTQKDVEDAVDSLGNYFLLRNGEFAQSLIREIERLKLSRLTMRSGPASMIRDQDLNLALLRASLGTTAQHDPTLSLLHFSLPAGPLRPLLPSLSHTQYPTSSTIPMTLPPSSSLFSSHLLGSTPLTLTYKVSWPLDLFLPKTDLATYTTLFSYLSALRKTHARIHTCWSSLSNSQRARRRWTGLGEGGTAEDLLVRKALLRCGWGVVRDMGWFLDSLLGYVMIDVVDVEFLRLKEMLGRGGGLNPSGSLPTLGSSQLPVGTSTTSISSGLNHLDFTTLRNIHSEYLDRLLTGCLLTNPVLTSLLLPIFEVCERFVGQIERWNGDVLPALLFEGSLKGGDEEVGAMVRERQGVVAEINETLQELLESFYEQLSLSTSQQALIATGTDASKSVLNASLANQTTFNATKAKGVEGVRRHVERLLLRLDFNGAFSKGRRRKRDSGILAEGGLA
ncbi:Spindle pole body component [Mycena sanguinolenta]|uniref:Spindle pole body component n=1 Tax=Mycena sanguinolenta TaxID=230812 RepID=A0A8H6XE00_9AGAR|nr:Spindle pole body component [Mycena sanguinolenta]